MNKKSKNFDGLKNLYSLRYRSLHRLKLQLHRQPSIKLLSPVPLEFSINVLIRYLIFRPTFHSLLRHRRMLFLQKILSK